jgi:hypothetical protein
MKRVDHPTATDTNLFTEGNPQTGVPATVVPANWLNMIQEEICAVIVAAEIDLDGSKQDQLKTAIGVMLANLDIYSDPHEWSEGQRYASHALTIDAETSAVTWDMEANPVAVLPMTGNVTTFTMTNFKAGGTYELTTLQDASVVRSVIWPAAIRWPGGAAVELTQAVNAEDLINFSVRDNGGTPILRGYAGQDFKAVV